MTSPQGRLGDWGEAQARFHLESKGYVVEAVKYRSRWGEVDIVARHRGALVFVEVKTRRGAKFGIPEESITPAKAQRLIATAQEYLHKNGQEQTPWRVDLVSLQLDPSGKLERVSHLENVVEG